jgi:hypothetical protein
MFATAFALVAAGNEPQAYGQYGQGEQGKGEEPVPHRESPGGERSHPSDGPAMIRALSRPRAPEAPQMDWTRFPSLLVRSPRRSSPWRTPLCCSAGQVLFAPQPSSILPLHVQIPGSCALLGLALTAQAASADDQGVHLTHALDIVLGSI